ncbi:MAG: pantoate--beta-alanine ligase [Planctomycetota bacterium]
MQTFARIPEFRAARRSLDGTVGFVATMGALHAGHRALVERARADCDHVIASVFVNPAQFDRADDLARYPRTLEADEALLADAGCDLLFAPAREAMYGDDVSLSIDVGPIAERYEGAFRPGHFGGVCLIVCKLFHVVAPQRAYFGRKDAQQLAVIETMVRELDFDLDVVPVETVRDADGLALSSRNRRLGEAGRREALGISAGLFRARDAFQAGERDRALLEAAARTEGVDYEYCACVDPVDFGEPRRGYLMIAAATVDSVRLIDNVRLG